MRHEKDSALTLEPSDGAGEFSDFPRALKEGEIGEWILLDGVSPSQHSGIRVACRTF